MAGPHTPGAERDTPAGSIIEHNPAVRGATASERIERLQPCALSDCWHSATRPPHGDNEGDWPTHHIGRVSPDSTVPGSQAARRLSRISCTVHQSSQTPARAFAWLAAACGESVVCSEAGCDMASAGVPQPDSVPHVARSRVASCSQSRATGEKGTGVQCTLSGHAARWWQS